MASLVEILEKTLSADAAHQQEALQFLEQAKQHNFAEYIQHLSAVLVNQSLSAPVRTQAGLQLKNCISLREISATSSYSRKWLTLPENVKSDIKTNIMTTLGTEPTTKSAAAQCCSTIAAIELLNDEWVDFVAQIVAIMAERPASKVACVEAIGYLCDTLANVNSIHLANNSDKILNAIISCMQESETNSQLVLTATQALYNSLAFCKTNFNKEHERNYLMECICYATQHEGSDQVKVAALQCMSRIVTLYYEFLSVYMVDALFPITRNAIKSQNDDICLQGIEFWSTICDEEYDILIETDPENTDNTQGDASTAPTRHCMFYAKGAVQHICPLILEVMKNRRSEMDDGDDDEWTPAKAAGVSLLLFAKTVGEAVANCVIPFVNEYIQSPDWKVRDASLVALGSIIEGVEGDKLKELVSNALPRLVLLLGDSSVCVRDTAAWCIGRAVEYSADGLMTCYLTKESLQNDFVAVLLRSLTEDETRVAINVCWTLSTMAESLYELAKIEQNTDDPATYALSGDCFSCIVDMLFQTTERHQNPNSANHQSKKNLQTSAYEAVMSFMKHSPTDCLDGVIKATNVILHRIDFVLKLHNKVISGEDGAAAAPLNNGDSNRAPVTQQYYRGGQNQQLSEHLEQMHSNLCATLETVVRRIPEKRLLSTEHGAFVDSIMGALLMVLDIHHRNEIQATLKALRQTEFTPEQEQAMALKLSSSSANVKQDALQAISSVIEQTKDGFAKYMDTFMPHLRSCLLCWKNIPPQSEREGTMYGGDDEATDSERQQLTISAICCIDDMTRGFGPKFLPMANDFAQMLGDVFTTCPYRSVKPHVIATLGSIAFAIGAADFQPYFETTMDVLKFAALTRQPGDRADNNVGQGGAVNGGIGTDQQNAFWYFSSSVNTVVDDDLEFYNELQDNTLQACTTIVQTFASNPADGSTLGQNPYGALLFPHFTTFLTLLVNVHDNDEKTDDLVKQSCGLVGDLARAFSQNHGMQLAQSKEVQRLLDAGKQSRSLRTRQLAIWSSKELKKIVKACSG